MKTYDIYSVKFKYEGSDEYKWRPALVIGDQIFKLSKITSNLNRKETPYYIIKDWKEAGLIKSSLVRITQTIDITPGILSKYVGHLSEEDEKNIRELMYPIDVLDESDYRFFNKFI